MFKKISRWERLLFLVITQTELHNLDKFWLLAQKSTPAIMKTLFIVGMIVFWYWNWQLLLATTVGVALMLLVYFAQSKQGIKYWQILANLIVAYNRKLTIAVVSGGLGVFITYLSTSIWTDSENKWLATGSILQGLGTLVILLLLGWQFWGIQSQKKETKFNELSQDLTTLDPLKRLITIRQLTALVSKNKMPRKYHGWLIEYYQLMLSSPQEKLVEEALLDGLESLDVRFMRNQRKELKQIQLDDFAHRKISLKKYKLVDD